MKPEEIKEKIEHLKEMLKLTEQLVDRRCKECNDKDNNECIIEMKKAFIFLFKKQPEEIQFTTLKEFYDEIKKIHPYLKEREFPEYENGMDISFHLGYEVGRIYEKLRPKD